MASVKVVLDTRRRKLLGNYPVKLRVTHFGVSRDMSLGISLKRNHWRSRKQEAKNSAPNYLKINKLIFQKRKAVEERIIDLSISHNKFNIDDILQKEGKFNGVEIPRFKEFGYQAYNSLLSTGKIGNAKVYKNAIDQLCNRMGKNVKLSDINYRFLLKYEELLSKEGLTVNGISQYMRTLKAIINRAIKLGYIRQENYPFYHYKIKTEKTRKRTLSKSDFQKILAQELPVGSREREARDHFTLIFCLIGINWMDLAYLRKEDLREDRIVYTRKKTHKLYDIPLSPRAQEIIARYSGESKKYLLPILPENELLPQQERVHIDNKLRLCNKYLKKLGQKCNFDYPLTSYIPRFCWPNYAKQLGFDNSLIADAMGHSSFGNPTTAIYLDRHDISKIKEANLAVQEFVFEKHS